MRSHRMFARLAVFLAAFGLAGMVYAQEVSPDPTTVEVPAVGETIAITINVANINNLFGWQLEVAYDENVVTFKGFTEGNFLKQGGASFAVPAKVSDLAGDADGLNKVVLLGATSLVQAVSGDGDLGVVEFEVVGQAQSLIKLLNPKFLDGNAQDIAVTIGGSVTLTVPAVNEPPVADAGADMTATVGDTVAFNGTASTDPDGTIVSYTWDFGDGTTADGAEVTHVFTAEGTYTVSLTVEDDGGLTSTDTLTVTVKAAGEPVIREHSSDSPTLKLVATLPTAGEPAHAYIAIWKGELVVEPGMFLEYQVAMFSGNPAFQAGVDLTTADGTTLRDVTDSNGNPAVDQNGLRAHPGTDLSDFARDQWYHRQISLNALVGKTITEVALAVDTGTPRAGLFRAYFDNIQITDQNVRLLDIYIDGDNVPLPTPVAKSTEPAQGGIVGAVDAAVEAGIIGVAVHPRGKAVTTWGALKAR